MASNQSNTASKKPKASSKRQKTGPRNQSGPSPDVAALIDAQARQASSDREEHRRDNRRRAFREWFTIILLFLAAFAAGVQAWIFHKHEDIFSKQLEETQKTVGHFGTIASATRDAADAAKDALNDARRPTISASVQGTSPFSFNQGASLTVKITLRNSGRIPANISILPTNLKIRFKPRAGYNARAEEQKICAVGRPNNDKGQAVFTGDGPPQTFTATATQGELERGIRQQADGARAIYPVIVGCLDYTFEGEKHHTGFTIEILRSDGLPIILPQTIFQSWDVGAEDYQTSIRFNYTD